MYQHGFTPLIYAAVNGHLRVMEYLLEKGADMEAKDKVSDVISLTRSHTYVTHDYMCVNVSEWMDSIDVCCSVCSSTNG